MKENDDLGEKLLIFSKNLININKRVLICVSCLQL